MFVRFYRTMGYLNPLAISKFTQHTNGVIQSQTLFSRLKTFCKLKELETFYCFMIKNNSHQDCFLMNQFITACSTSSQLDFAVLAYTQMENPNVFVHNALIRGFVQCLFPVQALEFYLQMLKAGVSPTSFTFSSLVKACTLASASQFGKAIHTQIWKNGLEYHVFVQTSLIDFYSSLGKITESRKVFDEIPERDAFAWTTMVTGYTKIGYLNSAKELFDSMPEKNTASWNTMLDGYSRLGNVESAELLFNQMDKRDLITWTTMITCYSKSKRFKEALSVFNEMTDKGINPDEVTMATVISACAHLGALELGKKIHCYLTENMFNLDIYIGSALVDMYAKCGSLDKALVVFFKLKEKNLFCWNTMIEGLAVHGFATEALYMFNQMQRRKIKPNGVTFVSILSACTHAGLVDEGRRIFLRMTLDYFILPKIEHYGCMVDLLSKAGLLEEALELIKGMNIEPNSIIWGAILGGCKLHRNLTIAQVAVNNLILLEPYNTGYYALLLNLYAEENRWSEVAKIRAKMKELGVEKSCPGSSWIETDRKIHQFSASDKSHPNSSEIYSLLDELDGQLKLADTLYTPR